MEALVNSLRSHLSRLTTELSSHQKLLSELRNLRERDARALREKSAEIIQLREEVQRLAGEVEVLRGVVEEGLKERRASKESFHVGNENEKDEGNIGMSQDLREEDEPSILEDKEEHDEGEVTQDDDDDEEHTELFNSAEHAADKTMRTDRATLGESTDKGPDVAFANGDDYSKIAAEVEERRLNRSIGSIGSRASRSPSPIRMRNTKRATTPCVSEDNERSAPQLQPSTSRLPQPMTGYNGTSDHAENCDAAVADPEPETPFPKIRGEHLERLFFSAPEHNAKTCTVCYRRRQRPHVSPFQLKCQVSSATRAQREEQEESRDDCEQRASAETTHKGKGREHVSFMQDPAHWHRVGTKQGLPPQTVVARVIREIEDDFTHYKR